MPTSNTYIKNSPRRQNIVLDFTTHYLHLHVPIHIITSTRNKYFRDIFATQLAKYTQTRS